MGVLRTPRISFHINFCTYFCSLSDKGEIFKKSLKYNEVSGSLFVVAGSKKETLEKTQKCLFIKWQAEDGRDIAGLTWCGLEACSKWEMVKTSY